jgi:hypothetical protein
MMDDYFDRIETQLGDLIERGAHRRRGLAGLPRITGAQLALACSTAIVVAIVTVALVNVHPSRPRSSPAAGESQVDPSLTGNFRILRRPVTPSDRLPQALLQFGLDGVRRGMFARSESWLAGEPAPPPVASIGLLPELSRRTTIPGTGYSAWVIPGRHGMCWFSASAPRYENTPFPYPAICVGPLTHPAAALFDGSWTDVEAVDNAIVGLVTDRVLAVILVDASGHRQPVPLSEGFYLSPLLRDGQRLLAVTRSGLEPLYPQSVTSPQAPRILDSAAKTIARSSHPAATVTGPRGLTVELSWEMTCASSLSDASADAQGYQSPESTHRLPAVVPIGFPAGSSKLRQCHLAVIVVDRARQGVVRVAIVDR